MKNNILFFIVICTSLSCNSQSFYFGADMSYVNEMEDCGVQYFENSSQKDPYEIFKDHGCNLVRLRLWHTPSWYDNLNDGKRYSDLRDIKRAISRVKEKGMKVLLDFHLSDNWADPSKQLVPVAWLSVVDNTDILKDSLYNYIFHTLEELHSENLLPEMVQIGNETNRGILLSPEDNQVWTLEWDRNSILFKEAYKAVRDIEQIAGKKIEIVLHLAGPANAEWLVDGFIDHGVTDFDIIGLSYYWAWHKPTSIAETGQVIRTFKGLYPDKEVLIVETGYIWTHEWNDNAGNIITETHPDYSPASPENQRDWLIDLTKEVIDSKGLGVIYWEPAWVSSNCWTQWGQGSHQEHATFFDFDNNLLIPGGIEWMDYNYNTTSTVQELELTGFIQIMTNSFSGDIVIKQHKHPKKISYQVIDPANKVILSGHSTEAITALQLQNVPFGLYFVIVQAEGQKFSKSIFYGKG